MNLKTKATRATLFSAAMASGETPGTSSGSRSICPVFSDVENKNLVAVLTKAGLLHLKQQFVKQKVNLLVILGICLGDTPSSKLFSVACLTL